MTTTILVQLIIGVCSWNNSVQPSFMIQSEQMKCTGAVIECIERRTPFGKATMADFLRCT